MVFQTYLQFRALGRKERAELYHNAHQQRINNDDDEKAYAGATQADEGQTSVKPHRPSLATAARPSSYHTTPDSIASHDETVEAASTPAAADGSPADTPTDSPAPSETRSDEKPKDSNPNPFLVEWDEEDGEFDPHRWPTKKKWLVVFFVVQLGFLVGVASSIVSSGDMQAAEKFGVNMEVIALQTAVYLVGFGVAAPFLGSLSEIGGRNPVYVVTLLLFLLFEMGSGMAQNIQTRVILRFWSGFFGSTPLSNSGGSLADIFDPRERTLAFPLFANAGFMGPVIGPAIGGYLALRVGQQWLDYLMAIYAAALLLAVILFLPETYAPTLLKMKAKQIRKHTNDDRYHTAQEIEREKVSVRQQIKHTFALPFLYLLHEPIVMCMSLYMTVVYIILFGYFISFPLVFEPFGLDGGQVGLTFIGVAIGLCITTAFTPWVYRRFIRITEAKQTQMREAGETNWKSALPPPEERLLISMVLTWCLPIGLFYQAWTSFPSLPVWPCISAGIIVGAGLLSCFISSYQYIIDVYKHGSATALGALTFVRYIVSGGTVMYTSPMFKRLGNQWALSLLAFLSLAVSFIPWIFFIYGKRVRSHSRYAVPHPLEG